MQPPERTAITRWIITGVTFSLDLIKFFQGHSAFAFMSYCRECTECVCVCVCVRAC
jgi:hypothetical protein